MKHVSGIKYPRFALFMRSFFTAVHSRNGFTLVELIMIILVLSVAVPVLLLALGQGAKQAVSAEIRISGANLGQALMDEIRSKRWDETAVPPPYTNPLGPEGGESRTACSGTPSTFDDADDYNGYSETCNGYVKSASVCYVNPADLNTCVAGTTDYKRIRVTIDYQGTQTADLVTLITNY